MLNDSLITIFCSKNMMLRNKYLLFIFLFLIGAQGLASQVVVLDSVKVDSAVVDTIELADAEFEAWLAEYAQVKDDSLELGAVKDSVEKKDFVSLSKEGVEAREREKNALIAGVMKSIKIRSEELGVRGDTVVEGILVATDTLDNVYELDTLDIEAKLLAFHSADTLIAEVDSTLLTINSQLSTKVNPLFLDWVLGDVEQGAGNRQYGIWSDDSVVAKVRKGVKDYVRTTAPELYAYHKSQLPSVSELQVGRIQYDKRDKLLLNLDSLNRSKTSKLKVDLPEMSKWSKGAKFQVHASQNYISSNWYKGGESNMAATLYAMGYFNYDNRKGLQWDNKAEWKLGLYGMASDSLRWLRVNDDLLRLNSKLGYKAFKNFYYTAEWDFQTSNRIRIFVHQDHFRLFV